MDTDTATITAPDLDKQIDQEVWNAALTMSRAIRNGHNHLDARPPYAEFKERVLEKFERMRASGNYSDL